MYTVTFSIPTNLFFERPNTSFNLENNLSTAYLFPYSGSFGADDL